MDLLDEADTLVLMLGLGGLYLLLLLVELALTWRERRMDLARRARLEAADEKRRAERARQLRLAQMYPWTTRAVSMPPPEDRL